jgi:hypothetical protein
MPWHSKIQSYLQYWGILKSDQNRPVVCEVFLELVLVEFIKIADCHVEKNLSMQVPSFKNPLLRVKNFSYI